MKIPIALLFLTTLSGCGILNHKLDSFEQTGGRIVGTINYSMPIAVYQNSKNDLCINVDNNKTTNNTSSSYFEWSAEKIISSKAAEKHDEIRLSYPEKATELNNLPQNYTLIQPINGNYYFSSNNDTDYRLVFVPVQTNITKPPRLMPLYRLGAVLGDFVTLPIQVVVMFGAMATKYGNGWH